MRERTKARVTNEDYNEVRGLRETSDIGPTGPSALLCCGESGISADSGKERLVKDLAYHNFHKPLVPTHLCISIEIKAKEIASSLPLQIKVLWKKF